MSVRKKVRWILAIAVTFVTIWILGSVWQAFKSTPDQIQTMPYSESRALVFDFIREDTRRFLDAAILVVAGLWSIAIVKKDDRLSGRDLPEIVMFIDASLLSLLFFYLNQEYGQIFQRAYWDVASQKLILDPYNSPYLSLFSEAAAKAFYGSFVVGAITVLSLCVIKEKPQQALTAEKTPL